ncbi:homeobox domain-containing protein [Pilobolus umbonatus]|nr:homeobox domain-containing protein [Pilobolus umbonatus]
MIQPKGKHVRIKSHEAALNKPKRKRITPYQLNILSELFNNTDTPNFQVRENTAQKLSMTNREVQVWFQNRRAKMNRHRIHDQKRDPFIYPLCWTPDTHSTDYPYDNNHSNHHHSDKCNHDHSYDSQSSVTSSNSSISTTYPQLQPDMRSIDILALAAEYVQRCDEEKRLSAERRKCWRPWMD